MSKHPDAYKALAAIAARALKPRDRLTVSQWADKHRRLSSKEGGEPGQWRTSRNPMMREIMDCFSRHSPVREVWIMKISQIGVTVGVFANAIGYTMDHAPQSMMVLMPTEKLRDTWRVQKLKPMLETTPCLSEIIDGMPREAANNEDLIEFPGGMLVLAGGKSENSYSQITVGMAMVDDFDRFLTEIGVEGDAAGLVRSRVKSVARYKLLFASTPTIKGASLIEHGFEKGDMRRYHVACPHCGELQTLKWSNLKGFPQIAPTSAHYICENGCIIEEHHKTEMFKEEGYGGKARWIPEHPERKVRSYATGSAIYCPEGLGPSWLSLILEFKQASKNPVELKTFVNHNLGETWEDQTTKLKPGELAKRACEYAQGEIPPGCLALSCGVDTQDMWLAVTLLGWGADGKHWLIEFFEIQGDTTKPETWNELEPYLHRTFYNSYGKEMRIRAAGIDSRGHRTEQVKDFVMRLSLRIPVYSLQGSTNRIGRAIAQTGSSPTKTRTGKTVRHGYMVWNVGTEHCKDFIFANLGADSERAPEDRIFHFPQGLADEYYDGLLSEVYDPEKKRYIKKAGAKYQRNEPLDTLAYAWAIGQHRNINIGRGRTGRPDPRYWERLRVTLEGDFKVVKVEADDGESGAPAVPVPPVQTPRQEDPPKPARGPVNTRHNDLMQRIRERGR